MSSSRQVILISLMIFSALCVLVYYSSEIFLLSQIQATRKLLYTLVIPQSSTVSTSGVEVESSPCRSQPMIRAVSHPAGSLHVITTCDKFLDRIKQFNEALDMIRAKILQERGNSSWNGTTNGSVDIVNGAHDDFIDQLAMYPQVRTVVLPWKGENSSHWNSLSDHSNLLLSQYYEWTGSDPLCNWIESPGPVGDRYGVVFNRTCNRYSNKTERPRSLYPMYLSVKGINKVDYWPNKSIEFPRHFHERPPSYVTYLHIVTDAIITGESNVYSGNVKLVPYGCTSNKDPNVPPNSHHQPLYEEVFPIAQHWGTAVFHRMVEIVPRLGASLDFLVRNPHVKILTPEGPGSRLGELMQILGLNPERMVTQWGRAKIVYLPRASYCGTASVPEIQLVSNVFRRYTVQYLNTLPRNKLILIRRTGMRRFTQQQAIEKVLQQIASEYNLEFALFIDNPVPSLNDTMRMFHAAVMVVAPHGAGLSNIVFSQPETYVIEGMCNLPHVNYCFQRTVVILGHHYHAIPSRGGCEGVVDVDSKDIDFLARTYLSIWKDNLKSGRN